MRLGLDLIIKEFKICMGFDGLYQGVGYWSPAPVYFAEQWTLDKCLGKFEVRAHHLSLFEWIFLLDMS